MAVNQNFKESTVSTSNHTQNYDLPLWTEGDKTSWLTQVNDAMNKIDNGMVDAKSKALEVVGIAADAKKLAEETSAESKESAKIVAGYNDRLTAVETTSIEHTNDITALNVRCDQMDVEIHSVKETQKKTTEDLGTLADQVKHNKEDADNKIADLTQTVTNNKTSTDTRIETLKTTVAANTKTIAQVEENVATLSGKVTALETEVGEVSAATQTNTNTISAINTTIESIKTKDTEQDEKIAANTTEISSLDGRVTALEDGGGGDIAEKLYNIANSEFNISSITQGLKHTVAATANLTIQKKNGAYIFSLSTVTPPRVDSVSGTDWYAIMQVEMPIGNILRDFPELGNLTNNTVPNLIGSGTMSISGNYAPAVITSIAFAENKMVMTINFAALEISVSGARSFNPKVRGIAIL